MKAARTRALNRKHAGTAKHSSTSKHTGSATRHAPKAHKQVARRAAAQVKAAHLRAWSPDEEFAVCSARAVAESLRLALGVRVADEDVLGLHWAAGGDRDAGASILDVLTAAIGWGIGAEVCGYRQVHGLGGHDDIDLRRAGIVQMPELNEAFHVGDGSTHAGSLILGLDLPYGEPHAVVAHDGIWWSWGEPYSPADFPGAVIEEAWAVQWQ